MYITLDDAKEQLSIPIGRTDLDSKLEKLIRATENWAKQFLNSDLVDFEESGESPPRLEEDIMNGMLLYLEANFDKDEKTMALYIERAESCLWPHRVGLGV